MTDNLTPSINDISISFLVTCHNETVTLDNLLERLILYKDKNDEIIVLDDYSDNETTKKVLDSYRNVENLFIYQHALNKNYGEHKNYGNKLCKSKWIFQLDADELPNKELLTYIKDIILSNPNVELFIFPRINDFKGVTIEHAKTWGWRLTVLQNCEESSDRPVINWPDFQGRLYKNSPSIKWDRRLHEKLEGYKIKSHLPATIDWAIYHDKTIETQMDTNKRYNEWFTAEENRGHKGHS